MATSYKTMKCIITILGILTKLHVNYSRTNYAKHIIVNKGVKIWNSLDKETSNTMFYSTFKKKLKMLFLEYT